MKSKIAATNTNKTFGIICPASPDSEFFINEKITLFSSLGYGTKLGKHTFDRYGYLAGSDKNRAQDIMDMFVDPEVDAIMCFRGGYGSIRTLPYIDMDILKSNPKFFCGYSDITILLNYFSKFGIPTFHGPMINSDFNDSLTAESFINTFSSNSNHYTYNLQCKNYKSYHSSSFSGKLIGGNLSMICSSIGTPYEVDSKDSILLLEEVNELPYAIDRMLTQLILSNKLSSCNGIIIGHLTGCNLTNYSSSLTIEEVILDRLVPLNIPIILSPIFGHDYPNLTIPIGFNASFNINNHTLTVDNLT